MIKDEETKYRCAYKEIVTILDIFSDEIGSLIPEEKIEFYKNNMDVNHEFEYDIEKELLDQNILYQTRCILANLFRDYIATEEDRAEILKEEKEELKQIEEEKRSKFNPDDIFKENIKPKKEEPKIHVETIESDLIIPDENITWFEKIKKKIVEIFEKYLKKVK